MSQFLTKRPELQKLKEKNSDMFKTKGERRENEKKEVKHRNR